MSERRAEIDDRRLALEVLVASGVVSIDHDASTRFSRPKVKARRRVVLFADEGGELRWWDAAG